MLAHRVNAWRQRCEGRVRTWRQPARVSLAPAPQAPCSPAGVPGHDEALHEWRRWCEHHPGQQVRVALSARWSLATALPVAPGGVVAMRRAQAEATARWADLLGLDESTWDARWLSRAAVWPHGVLACALPRALVDDVLAVAAHHHVLPRWIGPWWSPGLRQWLLQAQGVDAASGEARMLAMREPGWTVHAQAQGERLVALWAEPGEGQEGPGRLDGLRWSEQP